MGTAVFIPQQYAVGYSQGEIPFYGIQASTARERKVQYFTDKHRSDWDNMKYIISYPEIQSGKHKTPELCTYITQH